MLSERSDGDERATQGDQADSPQAASPGETVEHLVCRLMELGEFQRRFVSSKSPHARIEIQYVAGTEPEPTYDQTVPPF